MIDIKGLKCPNCGGNISKTGTFCSYCGSRIILSDDGMNEAQARILCPHCGENNRQTDRFCNKCGTALQGNGHSAGDVIPIENQHSPGSGNIEASFHQTKEAREVAELESTNRLLSAKLLEAESPGYVVAPTILLLFAVGGIFVYADSGHPIGFVFFAILGLLSIGLFSYHFFCREQEIRGIQNEIAKVRQKMAARKKEALESG